MPIYEYYCQDCDAKFEKLVSFSRADEQPPCPKCNGGRTQKLLSTFAAISRGGSGVDLSSVGSSPSVGGGCAGCSGGNCSTCH